MQSQIIELNDRSIEIVQSFRLRRRNLGEDEQTVANNLIAIADVLLKMLAEEGVGLVQGNGDSQQRGCDDLGGKNSTVVWRECDKCRIRRREAS